MVAVGGSNGLRTRLDSALVAKWPDAIDLASDIFIPGKTAAFKSQLMAALQSRDQRYILGHSPFGLLPLALIDAFGPVKVKSIYHNYIYEHVCNTRVYLSPYYVCRTGRGRRHTPRGLRLWLL